MLLRWCRGRVPHSLPSPVPSLPPAFPAAFVSTLSTRGRRRTDGRTKADSETELSRSEVCFLSFSVFLLAHLLREMEFNSVQRGQWPGCQARPSRQIDTLTDRRRDRQADKRTDIRQDPSETWTDADAAFRVRDRPRPKNLLHVLR